MKKLLVTILSLCILLIGCTHTESNSIETDFLSDELILQEQISPNKEYVTEEKDIVYYTVEVYQNDDNTIIVNTSSNSGFFKPIQYTVNYDKPITEENIDIQWTTLMGGQTPSENDQLAIADVTLKSESNTFSERKINFSNGAIEILNDTMNKNMK